VTVSVKPTEPLRAEPETTYLYEPAARPGRFSLSGDDLPVA
jgi:hypothetical protein